MERAYSCSICKREVRYTGAVPDLYPFCSDRCKMVDLGRWFNEQYTIERDLTPEDLPNLPPPMDQQ